MKQILFLIIFLTGYSLSSFGQSVAINSSSSAADPSAMLDVSSSSQGLLIPRMSASERSAITSPATGLVVYQTDGSPGFYFNRGSAGFPDWKLLKADEFIPKKFASSGTLAPGGNLTINHGANTVDIMAIAYKFNTGDGSWSPVLFDNINGSFKILSSNSCQFTNSSGTTGNYRLVIIL